MDDSPVTFLIVVFWTSALHGWLVSALIRSMSSPASSSALEVLRDLLITSAGVVRGLLTDSEPANGNVPLV